MEAKLNKKQQRHQSTLLAIRTAVDKLVPELGFEKMRIVDICQEVGVTPGAFYTYFKSKDELLYDRYTRTNKAFWTFFEEKLVHENEMDALKEYIHFNMYYLRTRVLGVLKSYQKVQLDYMNEWVEKEPDARLCILRILIGRGREKGLISDAYTVDEIALFLRCALDGVAFQFSCFNGAMPAFEASSRLILDWIEGIAA